LARDSLVVKAAVKKKQHNQRRKNSAFQAFIYFFHRAGQIHPEASKSGFALHQ
jgi:hypothetical protein